MLMSIAPCCIQRACLRSHLVRSVRLTSWCGGRRAGPSERPGRSCSRSVLREALMGRAVSACRALCISRGAAWRFRSALAGSSSLLTKMKMPHAHLHVATESSAVSSKVEAH